MSRILLVTTFVVVLLVFTLSSPISSSPVQHLVTLDSPPIPSDAPAFNFTQTTSSWRITALLQEQMQETSGEDDLTIYRAAHHKLTTQLSQTTDPELAQVLNEEIAKMAEIIAQVEAQDSATADYQRTWKPRGLTKCHEAGGHLPTVVKIAIGTFILTILFGTWMTIKYRQQLVELFKVHMASRFQPI